MISKVSNLSASDRPEIAIRVKDSIAPVIHMPALNGAGRPKNTVMMGLFLQEPLQK
jgi:hypothetical protein